MVSEHTPKFSIHVLISEYKSNDGYMPIGTEGWLTSLAVCKYAGITSLVMFFMKRIEEVRGQSNMCKRVGVTPYFFNAKENENCHPSRFPVPQRPTECQ